MGMWQHTQQTTWCANTSSGKSYFLFFFTHYVVCAGTTQWQLHHGDTTSSCHMAATATYGRALLHDMPLPDGDMTGSTATAVIRWQHGWQHTTA